MPNEEIFTITSTEASERLDKLLASRFPQHSRTYFQYLIEQGCVLVNGSFLKKRTCPDEGDEVEVHFLLPPEISLEPQNIPLDILYEDEHLLAVNKPPGMVVHPAPGHVKNTFVNALLFHCKQMQGLDSTRPGIVHRLDKDTSGILLAAKTLPTHAKLVELFSLRQMHKQYVAICVGCPKEGLIDAPIKRHATKRKEMTVDEMGKEAKSCVTSVKSNGQLSYVHIELITGRTHQIRVHLQHVGCPVLGDAVYGHSSANKKFAALRPLLHAHQMDFVHPMTGKTLHLCAPIPEDLLFFIDKIK